MNNVQFNQHNLALNDGVVRVYDYHPETKEYLGYSDEYLVKGVGIPGYSCLEQPPEAKTGFAVCWLDDSWQYVADNRGQQVYSKEHGQPQLIDKLGEIPTDMTLLAPATKFDYWDGQGWQTNQDSQKQYLFKQAQEQQLQLNLTAEKAITLLQRAVKLDLATEIEQQQLQQWERYTVLLNRLDLNSAPNIDWPSLPESL